MTLLRWYADAQPTLVEVGRVLSECYLPTGLSSFLLCVGVLLVCCCFRPVLLDMVRCNCLKKNFTFAATSL